MNTHYAVVTFSGDFEGDHPDEDLRGHAPSLALIAAGPEEFCWEALRKWTDAHPLRRDEQAEVVARHPSAVYPQRAPSLGVAGHCVSIDGDLWHEPGKCPGSVVNCNGRCCTAEQEPWKR